MPAAGRPGTNWKQVTPRERAKLAPLLKHYAKSPHPFTKCVRENRKRFGPRTEQVCAVVKDLIRGTTKWRGKGKNLSLEELREVVDMADASGIDCAQLQKARSILDMAEKQISAKEREKAPTAYDGAFPIRNKGELRRAILAYGRAPADKKATVKRFIIRRARELGATDMLPAGWK